MRDKSMTFDRWPLSSYHYHFKCREAECLGNVIQSLHAKRILSRCWELKFKRLSCHSHNKNSHPLAHDMHNNDNNLSRKSASHTCVASRFINQLLTYYSLLLVASLFLCLQWICIIPFRLRRLVNLYDHVLSNRRTVNSNFVNYVTLPFLHYFLSNYWHISMWLLRLRVGRLVWHFKWSLRPTTDLSRFQPQFMLPVASSLCSQCSLNNHFEFAKKMMNLSPFVARTL